MGNTMENLQLTLIGDETPERAEAIGLHYEIMAAAQTAANSLLALGRKLKRMRDTGGYTELGFASFADYTERAVGIRQRQAYNYIGVVEKLPAQLIEENAAAGITKLALLAKLGPDDREEAAGDLASITVSELHKLIEEKNGLTEQLSLLQEERDEPVPEQETAVDISVEIEKAQDEARAAALQEAQRRFEEEAAKLKAEYEQAALHTAQELKKAQKEKDKAVQTARAEARRAAEEKMKEEMEQAKREAMETAAQEQEEKYKAELCAAREQARREQQRAEETAKRLALNSDADGIKFALLFDDLQQKAAAIMDMVDELTANGKALAADKFAAALSRALHALARQASEMENEAQRDAAGAE